MKRRIKAPVAIFIYKRKEHIRKIMGTLSQVKPERIYIIADGPKDKEDKDVTQEARRSIVESITWDCKVYKNFSDKNLGLKLRFKSGLDWVFSKEKAAIFLEDDCIPNLSFFYFCDQLLNKYENTTEVMSISGNNFVGNKVPINKSYYFSRYPHVWGWATWKRAWDLYDSNLSDWKKRKSKKWLEEVIEVPLERAYWGQIFESMHKGEIDTWDYQWVYALFKNSGLSITPKKNLVTNVGLDSLSTHTKFKTKSLGVKNEEIELPLTHPGKIRRNKVADRETAKKVFLNPLVILSIITKKALKNIWKTK